MKIAPTLVEDVKRRRMGEMARECRFEDCKRCERGANELRALLAVARAAMRLDGAVKELDRRGFIWSEKAERVMVDVTRALARLEKVSKP
jgi:hypothetical protein